jgi:hypothetical protein
MSPVTPPTMTKTCRQRENDRPGGQELAEGVAHRQRGPQAALHDQAEHEQDRHDADEPELLADRRHDEVGARVRHRAGTPLTEPVPVRPPVPKPNSDCTSWKPAPSASSNGSSQMATRRCTWLKMPWAT